MGLGFTYIYNTLHGFIIRLNEAEYGSIDHQLLDDVGSFFEVRIS
jgi:hypothetical protein